MSRIFKINKEKKKKKTQLLHNVSHPTGNAEPQSYAIVHIDQACTSPTFDLSLIFGNNLFVLLHSRLR